MGHSMACSRSPQIRFATHMGISISRCVTVVHVQITVQPYARIQLVMIYSSHLSFCWLVGVVGQLAIFAPN